MTEFVVVLVLVAMLAGLIGTVLPVLPGLPLIWAAGLLGWFMLGFSGIAWFSMLLLTVLLVAGMVATVVLPSRIGGQAGVPRHTLLLAAVGGVVGFFVIPIVGLPVGALIALSLAERSRLGDWPAARRTTLAVLRGFGIGALIEFGAGLLMAAVWLGTALLAP